jgi:hypothetical protein
MAGNAPSESFDGIIYAITNIITTVSGVGTTSFTLNPSGYAANFGGIVEALQDLNSTLSGVGGGSAVVAGSGIYTTTSGSFTVFNATVTSASGVVYTAGSGLYLRGGSEFNLNVDQTFQTTVSGRVLGAGSNTIVPSGNYILVSGVDVSSIKTYTAGDPLNIGNLVCFDAGSLVQASAASGVAAARYNVIGVAVTSGNAGALVRVNSDNIVTLGSQNITAETQLVPGDHYYLSKYYGEVTRYSTASGVIDKTTGGYGALVYVGRAISTTELEVEIQAPVILTE